VKEFAHLKWGLFDEDVSINEKVAFRLHNENSELSSTRCAENNNIYLAIISTLCFIIQMLL